MGYRGIIPFRFPGNAAERTALSCRTNFSVKKVFYEQIHSRKQKQKSHRYFRWVGQI